MAHGRLVGYVLIMTGSLSCTVQRAASFVALRSGRIDLSANSTHTLSFDRLKRLESLEALEPANLDQDHEAAAENERNS